ncbi:uncharacterized protein LY89DRAFT_590203 [Mollisia scopiformis]|uniref:SsuA/THI5-like domain-containing protein n=1 Tax=Mollisia scopiformis TaxID=149040 RepID=A0A194X2S3_MOLSC|nr:uncharacterized protein LY89DRAFT_590203 [Mollisia scopiformis]KUJ14486.1 hypothetical protein LY89DRAFT_590203 [Mollisia scopiformis]
MDRLWLFITLALILPYTSALRIASALNTIEYTPELIASQDYANGSTFTIVNGQLANLVSDTSIDIAANAETQALRQFATHKNVRIIYTVAEVYYRIAANKKTVSSAKDLKGKKIATFPGTSAAYFVERYMASVGLGEGDYTVVTGYPCSAAPCGAGTFPYMVTHGSADAVGMWEPSVELAIQALGSDALVLQDRSVYREIFNLHSTTEKLADPTTRKSIVAFLRALNQAEKVFTNDPEKIWPRVATALSMNTTILKDVWPIHSFNGSLGGTLPSDLLSVLVAEDQWVAKQDRRTAMSQSDLSALIDESVLKEAMQNP